MKFLLLSLFVVFSFSFGGCSTSKSEYKKVTKSEYERANKSSAESLRSLDRDTK